MVICGLLDMIKEMKRPGLCLTGLADTIILAAIPV